MTLSPTPEPEPTAACGHCGRRFIMTRYQLGQLARGRKVYCSAEHYRASVIAYNRKWSASPEGRDYFRNYRRTHPYERKPKGKK